MKRLRYISALAMTALVGILATTSSAAPPVANPCTRPISYMATICKASVESIDGTGNNRFRSDFGAANTLFTRVANANYADHVNAMQPGPPARNISNRIFNDSSQNLFSENNISQWGWAWGQFIDHDVDHEDENAGEAAPIPFDVTDPFEQFTNVSGNTIPFFRTPAAPGTGTHSPRQQINQDTSFIDASMVYGSDNARDAWLRQNGSPDLMLPGGNLPKASAKPGAPVMDDMGPLAGNPGDADIAGDVRANENIALTGLTTLFAREHNRIADSLPASLGNELRFQIARKEVIAEIQYITYTQFLPTLGVNLSFYRGYNPFVNPDVSNEFATVGFRAHSMVHGDFDITEPAGFDTTGLADQGIVLTTNANGTIDLATPLISTFGNPDLLNRLGVGPVLASLNEHQYKNDEQIDNTMRSTLFELPTTPNTSCAEPNVDPTCFTAISDLGADDIQRGRDHGMPFYNTLRATYGLPPVRTFTQITGESTSNLPAGDTCNTPTNLDFVSLTDINGQSVALGDQDNAVNGVRKTTLAARLKCIYGSVDRIDAFVGMVSEAHIRGTEFGPLQLAIWRRQFTALRDGDRFFYQNSPTLNALGFQYHLNYKVSLAQVVNANAGTNLSGNVFKAD